MSDIPFHSTGYGRLFFEHQLPALTDAIDRLAKAIEQQPRRVWVQYYETRHGITGVSLHRTEAEAYEVAAELLDLSDMSQDELVAFWQLLATNLVAFKERFWSLLQDTNNELHIEEVEVPRGS